MGVIEHVGEWLRLKRLGALRRGFPLFERLGLHLTPAHFYQPILNTRELSPDLWSKRSELVGLDINEARQLELLSHFQATYGAEYAQFPDAPTGDARDFHLNNGLFESVRVGARKMTRVS